MPQSRAPIQTSTVLNCHACNGRFLRSNFPLELTDEGRNCCPECGSEFVELLDQANQAANSQPPGSNAVTRGLSSGGNDLPGEPEVGGSRGLGAGRTPRIEVHAMFHPDSGDVPSMPLGFVDAISRFAPLNLPNGQQAFVLQVQDGALLSPFTMGIPFTDALAMNPGDWVVGDDLDAVVSRVLDAYMPPRRATAQEVRDSLPRLRVRSGPLSPRPTATLEAAALVASTSATNSRSATTAAAGGGESVDGKDASGDGSNDSAIKVGGAIPEGSRGQDAASGSEKPVVAHPSPFSAFMESSVASISGKAAAPVTAAADGYASCQPGELCTVCHDAFEAAAEVVELPCHHCFHEECIMPWLQQQNTCPVCRTRLAEGDRASGNDSQQQERQQPSSGPTSRRVNMAGERRERTAQTRGMGLDGATNNLPNWARSQLALPVPIPRRLAGGATADSSRARLVSPAQLQQQQREGAAPAAHFPILGALVPPLAGPGVFPSLTTDEQRMAEDVLAPLRTRFPSIQLLNGPAVPAPGASDGIMMRPPGRTAAAPVRRSQLRNPTGDSVQQQSLGQGTITALRGGFFNNPMLNLYGESSETGIGARASVGSAASGGSRSALRGGFFTSVGGALPLALQRASGGSGAVAMGNGANIALPVRRPRQPPTVSPQQGSSNGNGSSFGPAATGAGRTPEMPPDMLPAILWSIAHPIAGANATTATSQGSTSALTTISPAVAASAARAHSQMQLGLLSPSEPQTGGRTTAAAGVGSQGSRAQSTASDSQALSTSSDTLIQQLGRLIISTTLPSRSELATMQQRALAGLGPTLSPETMQRHLAEMTSMAQQRILEGDVPLVPHVVPTAAAVTAPSLDPSATSVVAVPDLASSGSAAQCNYTEMEGGEEGGIAASIDEGPSRRVARHTHEQDAATLAHQKKDRFVSTIDGSTDCTKAAEGSDEPNPDPSIGSGKCSSWHGGVSEEIKNHGQGAMAEKANTLVHMSKVAEANSSSGAISGHEAASGSGPAAGSTKVRKGRVINPGHATSTPASGMTTATVRPGDRFASEAHIEGYAEGRSGRAAAAAAAAAERSAMGSQDLVDGNSSGTGGNRGGFNPVAALRGGAGAGLRLLGGVAASIFRRGRVSSGSNGNRLGNATGQGQAGGSDFADGSARARQQ